MQHSADSVVIRRWLDIADRERLIPGLDEVFFQSSGTKDFANEDQRRAFRERWLGRYLTHYPQWAYVALDVAGGVVGYLVGSLEDPAATALFSDIGYFKEMAHVTAEYPAQLHVNLLPDWRGLGIGARLLQGFVREAAEAGAPGVHIVTGRDMRNVRYYAAHGLLEVGGIRWNGRDLVMLGRRLTEKT